MLKEKYTEEEFRKKTGRISDATLGKLPPLCQDGRTTSHRPLRLQLVKPDFQQEYMDERERKMITIYEQQQQNAMEKVRQMFQHNHPVQRQYHSARDRYDSVYHDEQDYDTTVRKTSGTEKAFPPKSVYHKRAYSLSNIYRANIEHVEPLEAQRLPHHLAVPSLDYPDRYGGRSSRRGAERQQTENQVIPMPSSFGEATSRYRGRGRGSQWQAGRLEEDQMRLEEQIRQKEIALQEKLRRVVEELGKIQREKYTSVGMMERRERIEVGSERGKREKEKERRENEKATYVEQERRERARERREREKDRERERWARELDRERERREREQEMERINEEEWEREKWDRERAKTSELQRGRREREQDRRERVWDRAQRRWTQEKHCEVVQRDTERNGCSSNRSIPPEVSHRRPMRVIDETPRQLEVELPNKSSEVVLQLLPCRLCHRNFAADRLEKHRKVCEKVRYSTRKVFDSSKYRAKGTDLEEYMKTNTRRKTPELKKSNWRQKHEAFIHNLRQARMPIKGGLRPQLPMDDQDYQTCPHCARRFAPGPAERHIPMCQNIRSRPPPPRRHFK
ncbi:zinc finger C2HC domain-containing protein 1C isoform X1 [Anguilla anguilla]|uniref:zinc finger C2HC domain-containing protein 1C isoform X1 n=2 Tax=Anguilla anguilla TaxID=7936 RepID=UPI0015A9F85C|nr:zinc finger C2HC domain-containing protein 1C isoform X1 [Anguilla anguilla]